MLSRRDFLKITAMAGASLVLPLKWLANPTKAYAYNQSDKIRKFIQPLRSVGADIPVAVKDTVNPGWWQPGVDHYTIDIGQFLDKLHPDLPNETRLWGFGQGYNPANQGWARHLGGIIAVKRGTPVQITFRNHLPADHILPVDTTIMGADGATNRADIHLHGGLVPWTSDGGPHAWWDPNPNGINGESFLNNQVLRPGQTVPSNEAEYYYPNNQGSRLLWYHDHTLGNTRINAYAGIATAYVIYDDYELSLMADSHLPGPLDTRTEYLVFQDKIFVSNTTLTDDPSWFTVVKNSRKGDLWYAHEYDPARWDLVPGGDPPNPSAIPEFFGDTILVNGAAYPYLEVEPRQYRFRLLNACNARFLNPRLVYATAADATEPQVDQPGPGFVQIATEGGFMPAPVSINGPSQPTLLLAPAERADLIVDFRGVAPGSTLILYNDAAAPYPMGDDVNDYYPGNLMTPSSTAGKGPNTRTLLQIRVVPLNGDPDAEIALPANFTPTDPFLVTQIAGVPTPVPDEVETRYLTLNETFDEYGRLIQFLGTDEPVSGNDFGRTYESRATEVIKKGTTEVWEIINLTGDVHPIHFHLVNVQVLSRQDFNDAIYTGGVPTYTGPALAPDDNELGWKETVRVYPGQVARVLMKFDLAKVPFPVPESPRTGGNEFVWHCHILEHEEHDMMRPLIITNEKVYLPLIEK
jgi:spore coat protein A, manganese oxidase